MFRRLIAAIGLMLMGGTSAGAAEAVPGVAEPAPGVAESAPGVAEPVHCSLSGANVAVKPLYSYEDSGYTAFRQFRGAELFVPAQPGLTAEWIDRVLTSQVAAGQCNFGVPKVNIQVLSNGGGFSVRLSSNDEKGAAEILRHAQQLAK